MRPKKASFQPILLLCAGLMAAAWAAGALPTTDAGASEADRSERNQAAEPLTSGRRAGQYVPQFYVHAVTGPLMNKSVCYVCRNGGRPVVMILLRKLSPELEPLLTQVDRIVDENRAEGLRSFSVLLCKKPKQSVGPVQTFAFNHEIEMPMTVATQAVAGPGGQNVHPEAAATVVLYREREVLSTFAFRAEELTADRFREVIAAVRRLVADDHQ